MNRVMQSFHLSESLLHLLPGFLSVLPTTCEVLHNFSPQVRVSSCRATLSHELRGHLDDHNNSTIEYLPPSLSLSYLKSNYFRIGILG